jgi:hypothetical protein
LIDGPTERSCQVHTLPLPGEQHPHHSGHGELHRSNHLQHTYFYSHSGTEKFYLEDKLSESEMRELKEAAVKKILSKESLEMKIISLQISTPDLIKTTIPNSLKHKSASKCRLKTKPSLLENTQTKSPVMKSKTPKTLKASVSSTKKYTTSFSLRVSRSLKRTKSKNTSGKLKRKLLQPSKVSFPGQLWPHS